MAVLILNRMPLTRTPYHEWLRDSPSPLVLFTSLSSVDITKRELDALRSRYAELRVFDDFHRNGLVEWDAVKSHEQQPFTSIVALSESDIVRAADLRDYFGLPGQSRASALAFRDKRLMKELLEKAGVPVTPSQRLGSISDLVAFLEQHGAPVVVKPRGGSGSTGVSVIRSEGDLSRFLRDGLTDNFDVFSTLMVEKFVDGTMYHVDGLIRGGKVVFLWPSLYTVDCLAFREGGGVASHLLDPEHPLRRRLQDFTRRVLEALPAPPSTAFHAEIFHRADGELLLNEIASRVGGARVNDAMERAFGINMLECMTRAECGLELNLPRELTGSDPTPQRIAGWLVVPPRAGILQSAPSKAPMPWIIGYRLESDIGAELGEAGFSTESLATMVVESSQASETQRRIAEAQAWFETACQVVPRARTTETASPVESVPAPLAELQEHQPPIVAQVRRPAQRCC